jgi:hypothetical protein
MSERATPTDVDPAVANEALSTIANEPRLRIVIALGDESSGAGYAMLPFSEVGEAAGIEDNGRLNYHLTRLVEWEYVASVDAGYRLTLRGLKAYQAVKSGFYADDFGTESGSGSLELDAEHPDCGGHRLVATYENRRVAVECTGCGARLHEYPVPPGPFDDAPMSYLLDAWDLRFKTDVCSMSHGFCPYCSGPVEFELDREHYDHLDVEQNLPAVLYWCTHCHWYLVTTVEMPVWFHPVVTSFFGARGVDVWDASKWGPTLRAERTVLDDDPPEVLIEFSCDDDTLEVVVDRGLSVIRSDVREG